MEISCHPHFIILSEYVFHVRFRSPFLFLQRMILMKEFEKKVGRRQEVSRVRIRYLSFLRTFLTFRRSCLLQGFVVHASTQPPSGRDSLLRLGHGSRSVYRIFLCEIFVVYQWETERWLSERRYVEGDPFCALLRTAGLVDIIEAWIVSGVNRAVGAVCRFVMSASS